MGRATVRVISAGPKELPESTSVRVDIPLIPLISFVTTCRGSDEQAIKHKGIGIVNRQN
jgi:hypothetical protein